jgi:acetyl-CoA carboxylase carboxyl transferase subunit alpha
VAYIMPFERPVAELEAKLESLRRLDRGDNPHLHQEIEDLASQVVRLRDELYANPTPWMRVQISRHPERPKTQDYLARLFTDVVELHGDRAYGDDEAMLTALATFEGRRCLVLGHRKGSNTKENVKRNFGSPHPEGFRKAMRGMQLADRFALPVVSFLDTQGAYPGIEAEERGQAWAIAECLSTLSTLRAPVIVFGIGEGGSGGALAIGFGDRLVMLENAYYSVVSPEGCASILFKDADRAEDVAGCLKMTAADLLDLGIADEVVAEPPGGAQRDPEVVYAGVTDALGRALDDLCPREPAELVASRYERIRVLGVYEEPVSRVPVPQQG